MDIDRQIGGKFEKIGQFRVGFCKIGPSVAEELLLRNTANRGVKKGSVARFSRDMVAGNWRPTGEAIKFDTRGTLLDGQNRLIACVESRVDFWTLVILDVPAAAQEQMDSGISRTTGDNLHLNGIANATLVSAIITLRWRYLNGISLQNATPTHAEALELADEETSASAKTVASNKPPRGAGNAAVAFVHYYGSKFSQERADSFVTLLRSGAGLPYGCPILTLRTSLAAGVWQGQPNWAKLSKIISVWNAWAEDREMKSLRLLSEFPSIVGGPQYSTKRLVVEAPPRVVRAYSPKVAQA